MNRCPEDWLCSANPAWLDSSPTDRRRPTFWADSEERERIKALERENRKLRKANEILCLASAYFAQAEPDGQAFLRCTKS